MSDEEVSGMLRRYGQVDDTPVQDWKEHAEASKGKNNKPVKNGEMNEDQADDDFQSDSNGKLPTYAFEQKRMNAFRKSGERYFHMIKIIFVNLTFG